MSILAPFLMAALTGGTVGFISSIFIVWLDLAFIDDGEAGHFIVRGTLVGIAFGFAIAVLILMIALTVMTLPGV